MLKKKTKIRKRLARIVLAALLYSGGLHGLAAPSVAEAAVTITVSNITGDAATGEITVTADPAGSMLGKYDSEDGKFKVWPDAAITGIDEIYITGSGTPAFVDGSNPDSADAGSRKMTVSGAATVLGGVTANYQFNEGVAANNNILIIEDASITGIDSDRPADVVAGVSEKGGTSGNRLEIRNATIGKADLNNAVVYAGYTENKGNAADNSVTVEGDAAKIYGQVAGGMSFVGEATGNEVNIIGGTVGAAGMQDFQIFGGSASQTASKNKVTLSGVTVNAMVAGGYSYNGSASSNTVTVSGGTVNNEVDGGYSYNGSASSNTVIISGVTVNAEVRGGVGPVSASDNTVTISGGTVNNEVDGGYSYNGSASSNTVTVSGVTVNAEVFGGRSTNGSASSNTVTVSGGTVNNEVNGGYSESGNVVSNTVTISSGTVNAPVAGGYSYNGSASSNTVTVNGGTVNNEVNGGYSCNGSASSNTVTVSGGTVNGIVYGGVGPSSACGNTVTVTGDAVFGKEAYIIGGFSNTASDNTVNILSPIQIAGLGGGFGDKTASTGNTLNIAAKNVVAGQVKLFQNMNFYLPADIVNNDTMLTVNGGSPTNVKGVTFGVTTQPGVDLLKGDSVNLISNVSGLTTNDTLATTTSMTAPKDIATDTNYQLSISKKDANTIIATVTDRTLSPNDKRMATTGKSPAETRAAVATQVNAGADLIAGMGMANASDAAAGSSGGMEPFAAMGLSSLRAQSGSHVDTKGIGLALGFAKEMKNGSGKLLVGPLVEYGYGRYDSYQDDGSKADGKSHYWGFGVIAKQTNDSGLYYEGSLRIGRAKSDYGRDDAVFGRMGYDSDSTYWGAHLGIGKVQDIGHDNTLDYYGKYFYSHTGGDTVFIRGLNAMADFGTVDSHRLRVGTRVTHAVNEKNKIYGGLAYQYEFNGDARVTYNPGGTAPSPSVKGSSGMVELGWQVKPGRSPMVIDLGMTGWVGKQRGITANLQANWTF